MGATAGGRRPTSTGRRLWDAIPVFAPAVVAVVAGLCFVSTWKYDFVWDDRAAVKLNADVDPARTPWVDLWRHDFWGQDITTPSSHKSFRPISVLSYRFNYAWTGFDGWSYHVVNIVLHAAAAGLLTALALRLRVGRVRSLAAGLLFATHPVHVEAVACIVGRADVLSAVLSLAGLHAYTSAARLHGSQWGWLLAALVLGLLSTLSKEVGISTLAMFVAYDGLVIAHPCLCEPPCHETPCARDCVSRRRPARLSRWQFLGRTFGVLLHPPVLLRVLVVVVTVVAFMQYRLALHAGAPLYEWTILENQFALMPAGLARTLSVLRSHAHYMWLMVWPATLAFDRGYAAVVPVDPESLVDMVAAAAAVGLVYGVVGVAVAAMWRRNWGLGLLCAVWAVVSFFPASNLLIFVGTEVAERLLYFPSMGLLILAACCMVPRDTAVARALGVWTHEAGDAPMTQGLSVEPVSPAAEAACEQRCDSDAAAFASSAGDGAGIRHRARPLGADASAAATPCVTESQSHGTGLVVKLRLVAVALVVLGLAVRTEVRNWDWESERVLFERDLATHPDSLKALNNVGLMLLNGNDAEVHASIRALRRATQLHPNFTAAHFNLGLAYRSTNDERALYHLRTAASMPNTFGSAIAYLGIHYLDLHLAGGGGPPPVDPDTGETYLSLAKRSVERAPGLGCKLATLYMARGTVAFELRNFDAAVHEYRKAVLLAQTEVDTGAVVTVSLDKLYNQLALALTKLGRYEEALQSFEAAISVEESASVYSNMAATLLALNKPEQCLESHRRAVALEPDNPLVLTNAGYAMEQLGTGQALHEALALYQRAGALLPSHPQIVANLANLRARLGVREQA